MLFKLLKYILWYCEVEFCLEKITIGKQSKLIQTSTPQEALLEIPTTSTFTEEVLDPSNEPTSQCLSSYSIVESCKNEINVLKRKYAELEEKVNIDTAVKMKKLIEERDFYQSLIPIMLKQHEQMWIDFLDAEKKLSDMREEVLCILRNQSME